MFLAFYTWWMDELASLVTPKKAAARPWKTLLLESENKIELHVQGVDQPNGQTLELADLTTDETDLLSPAASDIRDYARKNTKKTLIRLSREDVLERNIEIPAGALDVIEPVLQNQMERLVPWRPDETSFGYEVGQDVSETGQKSVKVVATTRAILERAEARAQSLALSPFAIDYAPAEDPHIGLVLKNLEEKPEARSKYYIQLFLSVWIFLCASLGGIGLYQYWHQSAEYSALNTDLSSLKARMADLRNLQKQNLARLEEKALLIKRKKAEPAVMIALEALSRALPDDTYLRELIIRDQDITLIGKSEDPAALIGAVEEVAHFENARFVAATTIDEKSEGKSFTIQARMRAAPLRGENEQEMQ